MLTKEGVLFANRKETKREVENIGKCDAPDGFWIEIFSPDTRRLALEAILNAESKRRLEANCLTEEYIMDYLEKLESSLNSRVIGQFQAMERRI